MGDMGKDERALLVITNLSDAGDARFQWLYRWLDANAVNVAEMLMGAHYGRIEALTGANVTSSSFLHRITFLANEPEIRVLDVFLNLHGSRGTLHFDDGPVSSSSLSDDIKAANLKNRLRLLYSTACYGATHAGDFVRAGFRTASGALGVNANGTYDYPTQLYHWADNETYKSVVKAGNHRIGILTHDTLANAFGFADVNSEKVIEGKKYTRITSEAV